MKAMEAGHAWLRVFETAGVSLDTLKPFGEGATVGGRKGGSRCLLHRGLERTTAHWLHSIPRHVNSKHRHNQATQGKQTVNVSHGIPFELNVSFPFFE